MSNPDCKSGCGFVCTCGDFSRDNELAEETTLLRQQLDVAVNSAQPKLTVVIRSFPESNGKRNWTAMLVRVDGFDKLIGNAGGITIARGELWNRVAYEAECTRLLIGERDTEPHILDYGDDIKTPEEWKGETRQHAREALATIKQMGGE